MRRYRNPGEAIGDLNRARVRAWYRAHPGCTQKECAEALGLSVMAVNRHVKAMRDDWKSAAAPALPGRFPWPARDT